MGSIWLPDLENDFNVCTQLSFTEEMADICLSIPMALKRNDQTKNGNYEGIQSNVMAFETLSSEHKDFMIYAKYSAVLSNGCTNQMSITLKSRVKQGR